MRVPFRYDNAAASAATAAALTSMVPTHHRPLVTFALLFVFPVTNPISREGLCGRDATGTNSRYDIRNMYVQTRR